jgi:hypothetical protein
MRPEQAKKIAKIAALNVYKALTSARKKVAGTNFTGQLTKREIAKIAAKETVKAILKTAEPDQEVRADESNMRPFLQKYSPDFDQYMKDGAYMKNTPVPADVSRFASWVKSKPRPGDTKPNWARRGWPAVVDGLVNDIRDPAVKSVFKNYLLGI